ncbi:MAG: lysozyme inhibitor LprI family protein [Bryobacteraceae bacterium]
MAALIFHGRLFDVVEHGEVDRAFLLLHREPQLSLWGHEDGCNLKREAIHTKTQLSAALLAMVYATCLSAQPEDTADQTKAKCAKYLQTPLPAEASSIASPKTWPDCNSYRLYFGIGVTVDYSAARNCAWAERLAIQTGIESEYTVASVFGGSAMLSVLYANGEGVKKNLPLAIRFACEQGWAEAEFEGRIRHLESLRDKPAAPGSKFQFCDDITSGFMMGFCSAYVKELTDQKRAGDVHALSSTWPQPQQTAFTALVQTEQAYSKAHGNWEINTAGTARVAEEIGAEQKLRDEFLAALRSFEKGNLPHGSANDFAKADARLNDLYRKVLASAEAHKSDLGAVQPQGVRTAERAWLKYRDAWVVFAKLRYPSVSPGYWLTLLTTDRIAILKDTSCEITHDDPPCGDR